jgi:hypothetical protein
MRNTTLITQSSIEDANERLQAALANLRNQSEIIPIERARAIVASASSIIETLKVEAQQSVLYKEKQ